MKLFVHFFKKYISGLLVGLWAAFTLALLIWWVVFSLKQFDSIKALSLQENTQILKNQTMLIYEGITLFICMLIGSTALIYFVYRENLRLKERKDFLSVFTHDLKTTLTSLSLRFQRITNQDKVEKIKSDVKEMQKIGLRLNQQLQNALQFSYFEFNKAFIETVDLNKELKFICLLWPDLEVDIDKSAMWIKADASLVRGVVSNLIQNAYDHSNARKLKIFVKAKKKISKTNSNSKSSTNNRSLSKSLEVVFQPLDGDPFKGRLSLFRADYNYEKATDSSGLGLNLSKKIMKKFGGSLDFSLTQEKFLVSHLVFVRSTDFGEV